MAAHFRNEERHDRFQLTLEWLFVTLGETKTVEVIDAAGEAITCWHEAAGVTEVVGRGGSFYQNKRTLQINGRSPGSAKITAGTAVLEVTVGERLTVPISFHRVTDTQGHHSRRTLQDVPALFREMKHIITDQTGIDFKIASTTEVKVDLGKDRRAGYENGAHSEEEWTALKKAADTSGRCRVFFVEHNKPGTYGVTYCVGDPHILIQDHLGLHPARTLAHEVGHSLGVDHSNGPSHWLMNDQPRGSIIPKDHAMTMRRKARGQ